MADTLSAQGLLVPNLSAELQQALRPAMPSYGASGNPVDVTAQGSNTGPALMTAMEILARSNEIDMMVLVTSLASQTRAPLDDARIRAVAESCGKPMTVWSYTAPSDFGRASADPDYLSPPSILLRQQVAGQAQPVPLGLPHPGCSSPAPGCRPAGT